MRGLRSTLVLLFVFLVLVAYIYFVESKRPPGSEETTTKEKVFTVEAGKIQALRITAAGGEATALQKTNESWQVSEPVKADADAAEVSGITTNLASLEIQRVVEHTPSDLVPFGLGKPRVDVAFKAEGDTEFRRLLLGDKTATGGDMYAKTSSDPRVFLVSGYLDATFNRTTFDLRDKSVLKFDRDKADVVEVATRGFTVRLAKGDGEWKLSAPWPVRADYGAVEGLIGRLNTTQMKSIAAPEASDFRTYGLDRPEATATVGAGSARASLAIGKKTDADNYYARDAARPMVFTVEASLVDELKKAPAEYRRKDVFEFRSFNATRIEVAQGGQTYVFEKTKGSGENAQEVWTQVKPNARDVDGTKMDDFLTKLSNLRAQSFVESRATTGLPTPILTAVVRFDEGKKEERVTFGRSGSDVYAAIGDEPGAAKLTASEFDDAVKALDAIK